jgi:GrpB-like predicted nucleotidyltransferase (UPF0157 family)
LAFRDYVRAQRDVADEYAALKRELASQFADNREAYTAAKADFIKAVVARAM